MNKDQKQNHSVVSHLLTKVPVAIATDSVGKVLELVRATKEWDSINYIYILDSGRKLVGVAGIKKLMHSENDQTMEEVMHRNPVAVHASSKPENAAMLAIQYNIKEVPVVSYDGQEFLGVIGPDKILQILHEKRVEHYLRFSGISSKHATVDFLKTNLLKLARIRLPWLLVGLLGGIIGVFLLGEFEGVLQRHIALSFFIPAVVYIANAIALQSQALMIRLIASGDTQSVVFIQRELVVSFLLAVFSGAILSTLCLLWLANVGIAMVVGLSVVISTLVAVLVATLTPLALHLVGKDPALGAGPFATSVQDVTTVLVYALTASVLI
jgi:magnesium transporter